jgi:hypothetical protein
MLDVTPFFSTDDFRPAMSGIMYDGQWANATNSHIAIRWPHITEDITKGAPNVGAAFESFLELYKETDNFIFHKNDYREWVKTLPIVKEKIACKECVGTGEVEWEYTSIDGIEFTDDHDCPLCNGTGGWETGNMVPDSNLNYTTTGGVVFSQVNMAKLLLVMDYANVNTCYFMKTLNLFKGCMVKIDVYEILIMPINNY